MASITVLAAFDQSTLAQVAKLENWDIRFSYHIEDGLGRAAEAVQGEAEVYMWDVFINPQGQIEDSLQNQVNSPTQAQVWTEEPYGQRLEFGFSGMTDSLGRTYPYWPDYHWAEVAAANSIDTVQAIFWAEMETCANGA